MDRDRFRVFRVCAGLTTGLIRAPIRDNEGRPARQRWTPPWSDEHDRFDDPTEFLLPEINAIAKQYRRMKLGLPFVGGDLLKASEGFMVLDGLITAENNKAFEAPETGVPDNG